MAKVGFITVSPLAGEELHFHAMTGDEEMSRPFQYVVDVLSKKPDIKLADALGQKMTVTVEQSDLGLRCFNGHVTRFSQVGMRGTYFAYRAVLHPWLWFLAHTSDCRIFQNKSIPEIVKKIFRKYPVNAFREVLEKPSEDYPAREYTVQYRETDLRFVNRLLEEAGISYHFEHEADKHTLVLTDSISGREHRKGYATVPLRPQARAGEIECLNSWHVTEEVKTASYVLRDFDYLNPGAPLLAQLAPGHESERQLTGERYDYPGRYRTQEAGDQAVKVRLNEAQSFYQIVHAAGPVRGLGVGNIFMLIQAPFSDGKTEHLVVKALYELQGHDPESGDSDTAHDEFACSMTLVDSKIPFRSPCRTPKPIVQGPQTAIVVGPKKDDDNPEEIWTDDHGRVLVRFHWERLGRAKPNDPERADDDKDNESTPCFVRVASLWAGKQWGIQFTPRIGQEVMVEFLEGDPDRPVITGRMYNNRNKPPYSNANKTQSGIKTHSTKGGGANNFNEIRFEDKKGHEELFVQAEKTHTVHVKGSRTLTVGGSESISIGGTRTTTVTKKDTVVLKDEHNMTVSQMASQYFKNGHIQNVYGADQEMFVEKGKTEYVTKVLSMESAEKIVLTVGGSVITMTPTQIDLTSTKVTINGSATVEVVGGIIKLNS
jgi:type VI secretion system secreted protein VgrG